MIPPECMLQKEKVEYTTTTSMYYEDLCAAQKCNYSNLFIINNKHYKIF